MENITIHIKKGEAITIWILSFLYRSRTFMEIRQQNSLYCSNLFFQLFKHLIR